jgi:hypothetical protein
MGLGRKVSCLIVHIGDKMRILLPIAFALLWSVTILGHLLPATGVDLQPWVTFRQLTLGGGMMLGIIWYAERRGVVYVAGYRQGQKDERRERPW